MRGFLGHRTRFKIYSRMKKKFSTNKSTIMAVLSQPSVTTCMYRYINLQVEVAAEAIFTARRYASALLAVIMCLSVCHKSEFYKNG